MNYAATIAEPRRSRAPVVARQAAAAPWGFLEIFVISQTVLPALLYLPGTQPMRVPIRVSAFAISLLALGWQMLKRHRRVEGHPSWAWLVCVTIWLGVQIFNPTTNTLLAGMAQTMLYF